MDIDCVAHTMVHEAVHSWVEYKLDLSGSHYSEYLLHVEEYLAETIAESMFGDIPLYEDDLQYYEDDCVLYYGEDVCANPRDGLQSEYNAFLAVPVDFSDLTALVMP